MFPAISETRLNGHTLSAGSILFNNLSLANKPRHSLTEEEQHLYNHHIIENFVESVREMNDVVLIPSKLRDLDPAAPTGMQLTKVVDLNDDLLTYYQMINVVKNDLFEPHNDDSKKNFFLPNNARARKISRQHRREQQEQVTVNGHHRNASTSSLSSYGNGATNGLAMINGQAHSNGGNVTPDDVVNGTTLADGSITPPSEEVGLNGQALVPLTSDQLVGQSSKQLTVQFIHHLRSLYTILEHFTNAADFITERYTRELDGV